MKPSRVRNRKLVVGNWKMHGSKSDNHARFGGLREEFAQSKDGVEVAVCVPFPYLGQAEDGLRESSVAWGVQDISAEAGGAYTGEVSATMAAEFGCRFAVVGHSERRAYHGEKSSAIAMKARRALERNVTPILCVGETLSQRNSGNTRDVISTQLLEVLDILTTQEARRLVIAYEPVWAIGTGNSASSEEAQGLHRDIRTLLTDRDGSLAEVPLLYGGSVKAANAVELFRQEDINGALVGGASLDVQEFSAIVNAASDTGTVL